MIKKLSLSTVAVFISWSVLDFIMHGVLLTSTYQSPEYAAIWRPEAEMMGGVIMIVTLLTALAFAYLYIGFVSERNLLNSLKFGLVFGAALGFGFGFATFATQPIPYYLAQVWFWGTVIEGGVGGAILGLINKK